MSEKISKKKVLIHTKDQISDKMTLHDLKRAFTDSGIEEDVLLPPGYQNSSRKKIYRNHSGISRNGKPVQDAKYSSDFWNKYDQVIYITSEHAERILSNPKTPKTLKKLLLFNLDQFSADDKKDRHMDGKTVPINITKLIEHDVFGHALLNPIVDMEESDVD